MMPCMRNCYLNDDDICLGCFRSLDEVKQWGGADNHQRLAILQAALQRKQAYCSGKGI
jgi:predicted Fe-S protein YdhL (DUF1289 family)